MKVAAFTVRGTAEQGRRWQHAAIASGHLTASTWLAEAADAYLEARTRTGPPIPLSWEKGRFRAVLMDGQEVELRGRISPPFGLFRGTGNGPDTGKDRTLVYIPTGRIIATLESARRCKALAAELVPALLRDPELASVVERQPGERESV